ncbi:MAG: hypothetical protein U0V75_18175 [Ferruginibacter sp.]
MKIILLICLVCLYSSACAQTDVFSGSWQMETAGNIPVCIELRIGSPEKGTLYPAAISIQNGIFHGVYELLLVKKNAWQLAISKNKYAASEKPFHIDMLPLNGCFDLGRDSRGQLQLSINRLPFKTNARPYTDSAALPVQKIITNGNLQFSKTSSVPWRDAYTAMLLSPSASPVYFGLIDTVYVPTRYGAYSVSGLNKNDMASGVFNGKVLFEQWALSKKERTEEIMIDTGGNVIAFFPDYTVNSSRSYAHFRGEFEKKKFVLDFDNPDDSGASFIAVKLAIQQDKEKNTGFQPYIYPGPGEPPLQANEKLLGSVKSVSKQLTLAIWDDAVEDGDTISISINGSWIAKNFPVKKAPQFLTITLNAGANTILFEANNLGSIPPNTSVLEIIDGKRRKAFFLETVPMEHSLLKIYYDFTPQ